MWAGQLISEAGTQMQMVAINWHVYILTHSPVALGVIGLIRVLPIIFFSLVGGVYADAHDRRRILFMTSETETHLQAVFPPNVLHRLDRSVAFLAGQSR